MTHTGTEISFLWESLFSNYENLRLRMCGQSKSHPNTVQNALFDHQGKNNTVLFLFWWLFQVCANQANRAIPTSRNGFRNHINSTKLSDIVQMFIFQPINIPVTATKEKEQVSAEDIFSQGSTSGLVISRGTTWNGRNAIKSKLWTTLTFHWCKSLRVSNEVSRGSGIDETTHLVQKSQIQTTKHSRTLQLSEMSSPLALHTRHEQTVPKYLSNSKDHHKKLLFNCNSKKLRRDWNNPGNSEEKIQEDGCPINLPEIQIRKRISLQDEENTFDINLDATVYRMSFAWKHRVHIFEKSISSACLGHWGYCDIAREKDCKEVN